MTSAAKENPAENRHELIPMKLFAAGHTMRIDLDNALTLGNAIYTDIEKTAENNTVKKYKNID